MYLFGSEFSWKEPLGYSRLDSVSFSRSYALKTDFYRLGVIIDAIQRRAPTHSNPSSLVAV